MEVWEDGGDEELEIGERDFQREVPEKVSYNIIVQ